MFKDASKEKLIGFAALKAAFSAMVSTKFDKAVKFFNLSNDDDFDFYTVLPICYGACYFRVMNKILIINGHANL